MINCWLDIIPVESDCPPTLSPNRLISITDDFSHLVVMLDPMYVNFTETVQMTSATDRVSGRFRAQLPHEDEMLDMCSSTTTQLSCLRVPH